MTSLSARVVAYASVREFVPLYGLYALLFEDHGLDTRSISSLFVLWQSRGKAARTKETDFAHPGLVRQPLGGRRPARV